MANAVLYGGALETPHEISCHLMKKRIECAIMMKVAEDSAKANG